MSAAENAALLRRTADVLVAQGFPKLADDLRLTADELGPLQPLTVADVWALVDLADSRSPDFLARVTRALRGVPEQAVLVARLAVEPEPAREPRVLQHGEPIPEVGSAWRIADGMLRGVVITITGSDDWTYNDDSPDSGWSDWSSVRHRFPLTEVLP